MKRILKIFDATCDLATNLVLAAVFSVLGTLLIFFVVAVGYALLFAFMSDYGIIASSETMVNSFIFKGFFAIVAIFFAFIGFTFRAVDSIVDAKIDV